MLNSHNSTSGVRPLCVTLLATATVTYSFSTQAQQQPNESLEVVHVTAHRIAQNINEVPASVTVIDHNFLETLQATTLSDLFRYEPGINVERSSGRHGDANINIRGIGGNRVLMLQDGVRMPSGFGSQGTDQGTGSFAATNLERVEVLMGPASALYGSDAIGGVVLLETLDPQRLVNDNEGAGHFQLDTGYSDKDDRTRTSATAATEAGPGYALVRLDWEDFSEMKVKGDFNPNPQNGTTKSMLAKWTVDSSPEVHWDFIADYWEQDLDTDLLTNVGPVAGPPGEEVTQSKASDNSERWRVGIHNTLENIVGLDSVHWQLDYQESKYKQKEHQLQENPGSTVFPLPASSTETAQKESFEQEQWTLGFRGHKTIADHNMVFGIDGLYKNFKQLLNYTATNLIDGSVSHSLAGVQYPGRSFPETEITQVGAYFQDSWDVSEQFNILLGLRYDYFENKPESDSYYENFNVSGTGVESSSDGEWSPHLGVIYQFTDTQQLYASYQTGFRAPPVDDQFLSRTILIPVPGVPHEVIPNSDLDPETSEGYELGWRWHSDAWTASVAYYDTTYENFIDSVTVGYREIPPVFVGPTSVRQLQYQNVDKVEIDGVEIKSTVNLNSWIDMAWRLDATLGVNFINGDNKETGDGLNSVGPDTGILGLNLTNPADSLGFSLYMRAAGDADDAQPLSRQGVSLEPFEPPSYEVYDFSLFWKFNEHLRLDAAVYNILDKQYWGAYAKGVDASGNLSAYAQPGRNYAATLSWRF